MDLKLQPVSIFFLAFLFLCPASSEIMSIDISNDTRTYILFNDFCFTKTGHVRANISSFSTNPTPDNASMIGFIVMPWIEYIGARVTREKSTTCLAKEDYPFLSLANATNKILIQTRGKHFIYLRNCAPPGTRVSLRATLETFNVDPDGKRNYLPDWEEHLPTFLGSFSVVYLVFVTWWVYHCYRNLPFVRRIHVLIASLLAVKCATLFIAAEEKYHVKTTGRPHGWQFYLSIFHALRTRGGFRN